VITAVADVPDFESDEVTAAQIAVDAQIEQCQFTCSVFHLQPHPKCPNVFEFERGLLTDDLALVPWLAGAGIGY